MKFCPSCGKQNEDASKFCKSCGYKLYVEEAAIPVKPEVKKVKKKSKAPLIIAIAIVAALAVFAGIFFFTNLLGNHRMCITDLEYYSVGDLSFRTEREFNSNGDRLLDTWYYYNYDTNDLESVTVIVYEYAGKHMLSGYTVETTIYDEDGKITDSDKYKYTVNSYKKDGLIYSDIYDEGGWFIRTEVHDKQGEVIKKLDEDGEVTYEAEYKYDFFGKIVSMSDKYYNNENVVDSWYELEFEYDGDEVRYKTTDAYDWDEFKPLYNTSEYVGKWNFYYFW